MGRKHSNGRAPQRSRLVADREERSHRANMAFSLFRPAAYETSQTIYSRLRPLQQEEDIPTEVDLFTRDHHCSLIQERRMRKGLVKGFAAGFAVSAALGHLESGMPGHGRGTVDAKIAGVEIIGRNRNIITAIVEDPENVLSRSRQSVGQILGAMGLNMNIDRSDHITLGVSKTTITPTEGRHIRHVVEEALTGIPILLEPVAIDLNGKRSALSEAKSQIT